MIYAYYATKIESMVRSNEKAKFYRGHCLRPEPGRYFTRKTKKEMENIDKKQDIKRD